MAASLCRSARLDRQRASANGSATNKCRANICLSILVLASHVPPAFWLGAYEREAGDIWRRQCELCSASAEIGFGFTTEEGNEALIAAGLPTLDSEQMGRALEGKP